RGGRPSEVAYYIDGFSQQDPLSGLSTANISNNAIQEVSITSGAFSAEYGHVASGIVNVITNSGSDEYHGTIEFVTDNFLKDAKKVYDHNYYTGDFSGPLPGLEKGFFYLSGERRYLQDRTPSPKTEEVFSGFGLASQYGNELPNNDLSGWSYQGKVDYNFTPNVKFQLSGNGSVDNWQEYRHYYNNPFYETQIDHTPRTKDENLGLNAKLTHTLNSNNFYNFSLSYFKTERFVGDGVIYDDLEGYRRDQANPEWDEYSLFREGDTLGGNFYIGYYDQYFKRKSEYIGIKADYNSQINASNTFKVGFDFQRHTLRQYNNTYPTNYDDSTGYNNLYLNRYGYDVNGNESDNEEWQNETKKPINLGIYVQDRFDWRGLIINAGLRFDYFDYKALKIKNPSRPFDPENLNDADYVLDESDVEASEKFSRISPRLGVSFPISDATQMHINYGKFFQRPDLNNLYVGYDYYEERAKRSGFFSVFASPNLEPEKVTQYEVGMSHQMNDYTAFDITAYYKDVQDLTQGLEISPAYPYVYNVYGNVDFGTIKGVDFGLTMRRNRNISASIKYSLSYATGTGSYAGTNRNILWKNSTGTPKTTNPLEYDQRHAISGVFDIRTGKGEGPMIGDIRPLENFGFNALFSVGSGTPYTPMQVYDAVTSRSVDQNPTAGINTSHLPWQFSIDIKLERSFMISEKYKIVPYLWIQNLLDNENIVSVYEGTGKADKTGFLESEAGQQNVTSNGADYTDRYELLEQNPKNYGPPRMIFLGLRMSF
ncbi:MAG: TonB-dependent receptor, partial [Calditrichaeota bacterium]